MLSRLSAHGYSSGAAVDYTLRAGWPSWEKGRHGACFDAFNSLAEIMLSISRMACNVPVGKAMLPGGATAIPVYATSNRIAARPARIGPGDSWRHTHSGFYIAAVVGIWAEMEMMKPGPIGSDSSGEVGDVRAVTSPTRNEAVSPRNRSGSSQIHAHDSAGLARPDASTLG